MGKEQRRWLKRQSALEASRRQLSENQPGTLAPFSLRSIQALKIDLRDLVFCGTYGKCIISRGLVTPQEGQVTRVLFSFGMFDFSFCPPCFLFSIFYTGIFEPRRRNDDEDKHQQPTAKMDKTKQERTGFSVLILFLYFLCHTRVSEPRRGSNDKKQQQFKCLGQ